MDRACARAISKELHEQPRTTALSAAAADQYAGGDRVCSFDPGIPHGLVLCPIGFILCFFALSGWARGLAVVGMFIGFVGTAILAAIIYVFGMIVFTCFTLRTSGLSTVVSMRQASIVVENYANVHGALPDNLEG